MLAHVKQREWLPQTVDVGSSLDLEADASIEGNGPFVLFVHVHACRTQFNHSMPGQPSSDTCSMERRMNEQRLHPLSRDTDEPDELTIQIAHAVEMIERKQRLQHERLEELNVRLGEEVVSGSDGGLPDFEESIALVGSYGVHPVLKHDLSSRKSLGGRHNHSATATIHNAAGTRITWASTVPTSRVPVSNTTDRRREFPGYSSA